MMLDKLLNTDISKKLNRTRLGETSYLYARVQIILYRMHKYEESLEHVVEILTSVKDDHEFLGDIVKGCCRDWYQLSDKERSQYDSIFDYSYEYIAKFQLANQEHFNESDKT